ncbi:MAG: bi-domain-containing oxidoreductase [Blastocatellia bacterium]|nr:bi-domain-containing oxidoreductase [Blastocatellia bacterium]
MIQVLRKGLKGIIVDEVPAPLARPHHVLIKPFYSLISSGAETADPHTDGLIKEVADNPSHLRKIWEVMKVVGPAHTLSEVRARFSELAILGYSGAGVVAEKHPTVTDLEVGDSVAYGGEGAGHAEVVIAGRKLVTRIPDSVEFDEACFTTLGSVAMSAARVAAIGLGETVVVMGLGVVGQLVAQLTRLQGGRVIALDLKPDRVGLASRLGADHAAAGGDSVIEEILALTGGIGADCVIVAEAAKSSAPARQAVRLCRDRGRIVIVGGVQLDIPRDEMYVKDLKLLMARAYGPGSYDANYERRGQDYPLPYVRWTENRNMEEFLRLVAKGSILLRPLITHEFPLAEAAQAYRTILNSSSNSLAVALRYPQPEAPQSSFFRPLRKVIVTPQPSRRNDSGGKLGVAVVGAGNLAKWEHLPNLRRISSVELRAICSTSGARGKSYARRFGAAYCASDYDEILRDPEVDLVAIMTRREDHAAQALSALRAGKHVFIEKPMALTENECREVCRAVSETGRRLTVGFNRRFAPLYVEMKKRVSARHGPLVIDVRVNSPGMTGDFWAADPRIGGATVGEACHFVDLLCWLTDSEPVNVSAYCLPLNGKEPVGSNNIAANLLFADGSIGNLTYCTVGGPTSAGERVEVFAPGLAVAVENFKKITVQGRMLRARKRWFPEKGYAAQIKALVEDLREGRQPAITARDGARATVVCRRLLESARQRASCLIDLDSILSLGASAGHVMA